MSGYWAIGSVARAMPPPRTITIDKTDAKIGRLMKKRENMSDHGSSGKRTSYGWRAGSPPIRNSKRSRPPPTLTLRNAFQRSETHFNAPKRISTLRNAFQRSETHFDAPKRISTLRHAYSLPARHFPA